MEIDDPDDDIDGDDRADDGRAGREREPRPLLLAVVVAIVDAHRAVIAPPAPDCAMARVALIDAPRGLSLQLGDLLGHVLVVLEQLVDVRLRGVQVLLQRLEISGDRVALARRPS